MHKGEYMLTVQFKGDDKNSMLNVAQENFKDEHAVKPHHEGWDNALTDLQKFLDKA